MNLFGEVRAKQEGRVYREPLLIKRDAVLNRCRYPRSDTRRFYAVYLPELSDRGAQLGLGHGIRAHRPRKWRRGVKHRHVQPGAGRAARAMLRR